MKKLDSDFRQNDKKGYFRLFTSTSICYIPVKNNRQKIFFLGTGVVNMLNQFMDEVVANGPEAVLPQNLDDQWLDMMYAASKLFIRAAAESAEGNENKEYDFNDLYSNLMLSSVMEILYYQKGVIIRSSKIEIPEPEIYESILCYAMSVVYESISREADMVFPLPSLDTIFDRERLFEIEQSNPELTRFLKKIVLEEGTISSPIAEGPD
ncbi:MAG: hypothetical protein C4522_04915 [Desulfobacteraceae bacterium]|nr:MAG: hypothetical protein C4522_04915 [Desulfobacteraceae bacterium]